MIADDDIHAIWLIPDPTTMLPPASRLQSQITTSGGHFLPFQQQQQPHIADETPTVDTMTTAQRQFASDEQPLERDPRLSTLLTNRIGEIRARSLQDRLVNIAQTRNYDSSGRNRQVLIDDTLPSTSR